MGISTGLAKSLLMLDGTILSLPADAGTATFVLQTDGAGNLTWVSNAGGGGSDTWAALSGNPSDNANVSAHGETVLALTDVTAHQALLGLASAAYQTVAAFAAASHVHPTSEVTGLDAALALLAPLASPALTGNPTAPTQTAGNNTTRLATTEFVSTAVANLINAAPGLLDTLDEIAAALGDDPNFATTMTSALAGKLAIASNLSDVANAATAFGNIKQAASTTATGVVELATDGESAPSVVVQGNDSRLSDARTPTAHTHPQSEVTNLVADLAAIVSSIALKANIASPTLTGIPAAPTAAPGTNTTQIATTEFVTTAVAGGGGGDVSKVGTPVADQIPLWTGTNTIDGGTNFTFNRATTTFTVKNIGAIYQTHTTGRYLWVGTGTGSPTLGLQLDTDTGAFLGNVRYSGGTYGGVAIHGATTGTYGCVQVFGSTHGTYPGRVRFITGGLQRGSIDSAGVWTFDTNIITAASTTSVAGLRVPHGSVPTTPADGAIWTTTAGIYVRINGSTVGPLAAAGGSPAWGSITGTLSDQTDLQAALDLKAPLASPTLTGIPAAPTAAPSTNTTQIATTAFVLAEVSSAVTGLLELIGDQDCSTNPNYPAANKGDAYYVTVAGKIGGAAGKVVAVGDMIVAKNANAGGTEAAVGTDWFVLEKNLDGALLIANDLSEVDPAAARGNLGVDPAGTDNSTNVTIAGGLDYVTIAGQVLTLGSVDLTTDVGGVLPNGNTTAVSTNTASAIVTRDSSGDFAANVITASLTGLASLNLPLSGGTLTGKLTTATGSTSLEPLVLPHGVEHSTPTNGAITSTTTGLLHRQNGVTHKVGGESRTMTITLDGGGSAITTGVKTYLEIPYDCTIEDWTIVADQTGSIVLDVWKDTYANFPPTVADTIAGSEKPTLASAQKNQDLTLSTWSTTCSKGDWLAINVDSAATVTKVILSIKVRLRA